METTKYTFWTLLSKYCIKIPIIQRDYAQGRKTEKANEIRNSFLQSLYEAIFNGTKLDLDFVYGSVKDNDLTPLDGQQRLTTLFLLHWYFAIKDNKINEAKHTLKNFTYETRISAREFCNELVEKGINVLGNNSDLNLSGSIMNSSWFYLSWKKDPTVKSMLTMLDAIDSKFKNSEGFFDKITNPTNPLISFQFIAIDNFGLTDNLYIKMNARGKALTEFENVKAKFEQYLEKINPEKKKEFAEKIDGLWTDFFWNHKQEHLIDIPFMRFFSFITEMLYYIDFVKQESMPFGYSPKISFDLIERIYAKEKNIEFLFNSLNKLCQIKDTKAFFESIFTTSAFESGKVNLFDRNIDLFSSCINSEGFGIKEKVLFFSILQNLIKENNYIKSENLLDLIRVIRNLMLRVRQQNNIVINSNLRIENIPVITNFISSSLISVTNVYDTLESIDNSELRVFSKESIIFEKEKAEIIKSHPLLKNILFELEDHYLFTGSIHNLDLEKNIDNLEKYKDAIKDIWALGNDSLITRAMLTIEDYSIDTGGSKLGVKRFFGNGNNWLTVLTNTNAKVKNILPKFLDEYINSDKIKPQSKLNTIINKWLSRNIEKDWRYYFIKYSEITNSNNNNFAWKNDFEIRQLSGSSLLSYHINPFIKTVVSQINDINICELNNCYGQYAENSPLRLKSGIEIYSQEGYWKIDVPEDTELAVSTIKKYNLQTSNDNDFYLLIETKDKDRIQIATEFCKTLTTTKKIIEQNA